jgi:predicted P-loop ATPase
MTQDFPRTAVFFGSTNDDIILDDPTGSRRYNVAHVKKDIDIEGLDRDALWSAANELERQGYTHYFDRRSQQELDRARQQHRTADPWEPQVTEWVRQKHKSGDIVSVSAAILFCEPETVKHTPALDKRIRAILRSVCGASQVRRVGEKITRSYVAP